MSEDLTSINNAGAFQTQIFYTDDPPDPDTEHETEWVILCVRDGEQVAAGWGATPRLARQRMAEALTRVQRSGERA